VNDYLCNFAPYELKFKSGGSHVGALLRFEFKEGIGYADCHPWPEVGDKPLSEQLNHLRNNAITTPTLASSLQFARIDATARSEGRNLFDGLNIPNSHYLIYDINELNAELLENIQQAGFSHVKVKVGRRIEEELQKLSLFSDFPIKWRFDFNARVSSEVCFQMINSIVKMGLNIDFTEDPFPYNNKKWTELQNQTGVSVAVDRYLDKELSDSTRVWVLKPAVGDWNRNVSGRDFLVTSYLDHPLGQVSAAYVAAKLHQKYPTKCQICGLLSNYVYLPNAFSKSNAALTPEFLIPQGTGFGFDNLLNKLNWKKL